MGFPQFTAVRQKLCITWGPTMIGMSCGTGPLTCGTCAVGSVRIKLNCRTHSWQHREFIGVGKKTTHLVSECCEGGSGWNR